MNAKKIWENQITHEYIQKLLDSMKDRINAVIENKGGPSGY